MAVRETLRRWIPGSLGRFAQSLLGNFPAPEESRSNLNKVRLLVEHIDEGAGEWFYFLASYFTEKQLARVVNDPTLMVNAAKEFCRDEFRRFSDINSEAERAMAYDASRYLPDDLQFKVDTASMMNSLECRSPLLDHKLAETVARFPLEFKLGTKRNQTKRILRDTFEEDLPEEVLGHEKTGFGIPRHEWVRNELSEYVSGKLFSNRSGIWDLFDRSYVRSLYDDHVENRRDYGSQIWALLMFELWMEEFDVKLP
jgi:asparagine synthase (glutamine-hydrolysing)